MSTINRKLASLQVIAEIAPHTNADTLELATVLGWQVVVRKGEYRPGDLTVFLEIDSIVPPISMFSFLESKNYRVRTIRLRGEVSQGLCMQPSAIASDPNFDKFVDIGGHLAMEKINEEGSQVYAYRDADGRLIEATVGCDLTDALAIVKYEPEIPACLSGVVKGNFPSFIPKTDEPRIQSEPKLLELVRGQEVVITEKLDGTSHTMYGYQGQFGVCSRNLDLVESEGNSHWRAANEIGAKTFGLNNVAIQSELCGPDIQHNNYELHKPQLFAFNVYDIATGQYRCDDAVAALLLELNITSVPIIFRGKLPQDITINGLITLSRGVSVLNSEAIREGIVIRLRDDPATNIRSRVSFKVINPDFLLRHDD